MPSPGHEPPRKKTFDLTEVRRAEDMSGKPVIKSNLIHRAAMKWLTNKIRPFLLNWKTTLTGVTLILHGAYVLVMHLSDVSDKPGISLSLESLQLAWGEIIAGFGLIAARDADKSSQDSHIRP